PGVISITRLAARSMKPVFAALNNPHLGSESACRQPGNVRLSETQVNCATISGVVSSKEREETLDRLRGMCLALPETTERPSHGAPTFFVRGKRAFLMVLTDHHGDG